MKNSSVKLFRKKKLNFDVGSCNVIEEEEFSYCAKFHTFYSLRCVWRDLEKLLLRGINKKMTKEKNCVDGIFDNL